jgi:hypothetical protein
LVRRQQSEATLYRLIVTGERFFTEYFRVGYYGMGFPVDVRVRPIVLGMRRAR